MTSQLPLNERKHNVRFYDPVTGNPVNLTGLRRSSKISFNWKINKGPDQVRIEFNIPYYFDTDLEGLNVVIDVVNDKYPLGKIVFQGVVEKTTFNIDGGDQKAIFQCIGEYSFLSKTFLRFVWQGGGNFFGDDTLLIGQFITNIIDEFNVRYPARQYTTTGILPSAQVVYYKGDITKISKSIDDIVNQSLEDWFITFDAARNVVFTDQFAVHELTLGRNVDFVKIARDGSMIINSVIIGYEDPPGIDQTYFVENPVSIAQFGLSEVLQKFGDQFNTNAAQNYGDKLLSENDGPKISGSIRVTADFNFEDIKPGDKIKLKNTKFGNDIFNNLLKVVAIRYAEDFAILQIQEEEGNFIEELKKTL